MRMVIPKAGLIEKTGCPLLIFANLRAIMRAEKGAYSLRTRQKGSTQFCWIF